MKAKKNICVFIHYCGTPVIPVYVQIYANELTKYFDEVVIYTNERILEETPLLLNSEVRIEFEKNEGYDFGLFYKFFTSISQDDYSQIACVNDSNVLIGELKDVFQWAESKELDFWGLVDSNQKPPFSTHENNYHIQSHFMVFEDKAIDRLHEFFNTLDIESLFSEKDSKVLRKKIIDCWEIGLSQFLIKEGLKTGSYIDSELFVEIHGRGKEKNVTYDLYKELISNGYPCIKKKIILHIDWRDFFRTKKLWKRVVHKYGKVENLLNKSIREIETIKRHTRNTGSLTLWKSSLSRIVKS
jgi:hypothetical protein